MTDVAKILDFLLGEGLPIVGEVVENPSVSGGYFVPVRLTQRPGEPKSPSGRTLAVVRNRLVQLGLTVDFILIDEAAQQVEESLRASLLSSFPDDVRNAFVSQSSGKPQAWIDFKRQPDSATMRRIDEHLAKFTELFAMSNFALMPLGDSGTATKTEILSTVRQLAPVQLPILAKALQAQGLNVPSTDWANRRLDTLRKGGLVMRLQDGCYVLTAAALSQLGTRKGRQSPDVRRFLALARRVH